MPDPNQTTLLFATTVDNFYKFVPNSNDFIPKNLSKNEVLSIYAFNGSLIYRWEIVKITGNNVIVKITLSVLEGFIQTFESIFHKPINEKNILSFTVNIEVNLKTLDFYYNGINYKRFMYWAFKEEFNNKTILRYSKDEKKPEDTDGYILVIGPLSSFGIYREIKFKNYVFKSDRLAGSHCVLEGDITGGSCKGVWNLSKHEMIINFAYAYYDMSTGILLEYTHNGILFNYDTLQKRVFNLEIIFTKFHMKIDDSNIDFSIPQLGGERNENNNWFIISSIFIITISIGILLLAIKKYRK